MRRLMVFLLCVVYLNRGSALQVDDIKQQYLPEEYSTLLVGEKDVPVFAAQPTVPLSRGVALIFLDTGQRGLTLHNASALAKKLNRSGWHTLIIPSLLSITEAVQPQQNNDDLASAMHPRAVASPPPVNADTAQAEVTLLAQAAFEHVNTVPGYRLLISQGMQASLLTLLAADERIPRVDSLITINPFWPQVDVANKITEKMANSTAPVLDLFFAHRNSAEPRQTAVNKTLKMHYRQKQLNEMALFSHSQNTSDFTTVVYKEIKGWLQYLGW
ncbi:DUF3530 family protein [Aestuariibacter sp. A3R04]|uniref:DUF3530 family protein n=1 Tax=Aestuariibacter sp. A3R04 TaxID=2841571 RepID=UPI001C082EA5|nr:alpha/beta hydrolase family protein [Aestuariibacter sp. A3R04]